MKFNENNNLKLTDEEIESCRHKSEKRWYVILVFINLIIIISVIVFCIINIHNYNTLSNTLKESFSDTSSYANVLLSPSSALNNLPIELQLLITGLITIIAFPFGVNLYYAKYRSKAIKFNQRK